MTDLVAVSEGVLREFSYRTKAVTVLDQPAVSFESDVVMGFTFVFPTCDALLEGWRSAELAFLRTYSSNLRQAGAKAWNVYSIFLCAETCSVDSTRAVKWIEEDLERTRKLTGVGLRSRGEVVQALLPLLPLQNEAELPATDWERRLRTRLESLWPKASSAILDPSIDPSSAIKLLRRDS